MFRIFSHHVFNTNLNVLVWSWGSECSHDVSVVSNLGGDQMIYLIEEPFSFGFWEFSRNTGGGGSNIGNHKFSSVVCKGVIWRFSIMNLTSAFIPEPLLSFIVSHLMFKEQISSWPVGSPVFSIGGENKVIIRLLVRFFKMKVHASIWLHSCEFWLSLNVSNIMVKYFISVAVKNFNFESNITVIWDYTSTKWCFSSSSTPCVERWARKSGVISFM